MMGIPSTCPPMMPAGHDSASGYMLLEPIDYIFFHVYVYTLLVTHSNVTFIPFMLMIWFISAIAGRGIKGLSSPSIHIFFIIGVRHLKFDSLIYRFYLIYIGISPWILVFSFWIIGFIFLIYMILHLNPCFHIGFYLISLILQWNPPGVRFIRGFFVWIC